MKSSTHMISYLIPRSSVHTRYRWVSNLLAARARLDTFRFF
jgi:hypothetical protein